MPQYCVFIIQIQQNIYKYLPMNVKFCSQANTNMNQSYKNKQFKKRIEQLYKNHQKIIQENKNQNSI
jgi:hypothetical protein